MKKRTLIITVIIILLLIILAAAYFIFSGRSLRLYDAFMSGKYLYQGGGIVIETVENERIQDCPIVTISFAEGNEYGVAGGTKYRYLMTTCPGTAFFETFTIYDWDEKLYGAQFDASMLFQNKIKITFNSNYFTETSELDCLMGKSFTLVRKGDK